MTHLPQKNVNSIQFEKGIVHANPARFNPRFTYFEGKKPRGLFFFSQSQTHRDSSELRNSSERPRRFPEIFGNSRIIFGNSETLQDKNLTPLAQKKMTGIVLSRHSGQSPAHAVKLTVLHAQQNFQQNLSVTICSAVAVLTLPVKTAKTCQTVAVSIHLVWTLQRTGDKKLLISR